MINAVSNCCVKANFIKPAKDNWVPCEVRLLTDDEDTFLCIKSRPLGFGQTDEDLKTIFTGISDTGTILSTTQLASITPVTRAFTALCNLSEYKSCTMVTVSINDVGHFALKLVPTGIFGNKRLYLAVSNETEAASWMSLIKTNLGKRKKTASNQLSQSQGSLVGTLRSSDRQDALRDGQCTNDKDRFELDIDTIDNEVYEPCSAHDLIPAVIQQRGDWEKLHLFKMDCFLRLTDDRLELLDHNGERVLHWFPYLLIRRFGAVEGVLRLDAGRRCSTGDGNFFFACSPSNGQQVDAIVSQIRQLALEAKQRLRQEQAARQQLLQHSFGADLGLLPPPVPSKGSFVADRTKALSKLGLSPKVNSHSTNNVGGCESGRSCSKDSSSGERRSWGNFVSASSTSSSSRRQVEGEEGRHMKREKVQENFPPDRITHSSLKKAVDENSEGFIASPGKAVIIEPNINGQLKAAEPLKATSLAESKDVTSNGNANQFGLYDNVPAPDSEEKANGGGTKIAQSWRFNRSSQPPRLNERRLENTNLPPAPPPPQPQPQPTTSPLLTHPDRDVNTSITNGLESDSGRSEISSTFANSIPPVIAPKPFVNGSSRTFDQASYRQSSLESPRHSWLAGVSNMRTYRPCREEALKGRGQNDVTAGFQKDSQQSSPVKSLSFESGIYESQEKCPSDLGRLNMRGLDEVLQELRDANQNVTSAVQAAERQRRAHGYHTPHRIQQQSSQPTSLARISNAAPAWSIKHNI